MLYKGVFNGLRSRSLYDGHSQNDCPKNEEYDNNKIKIDSSVAFFFQYCVLYKACNIAY